VTACHNLGSIANVTVVPERAEDVLAFDTGPANALIDAFARRVPGAPGRIDRDGEVSARGAVDDGALATMEDLARPFLDRAPPKSAGFDEIGPALADRVLAFHAAERPEDLVRTAVELTARTVARAYERHVLPRFPALRRVLFSGGGTRNRTLVAALSAHLAPLGLSPETLDDRWSKAKEAVAFALLGDETLAGRPGNLPGATGARRPVVLGKISP
jgi:anhydro-N-acetylmuramic acid kinase